MNLTDVETALAEIADGPLGRAVKDNEMAHAREDDLMRAVLRSIADGTAEPSPAELAAAALRIDDFHYDRWYA